MWDVRDVRKATLPDLVRMCGPLAEQLEVSILRQDATRTQGERRSSDASPLIYRAGAADVLDRIAAALRFILAEWVLEQDRPVLRMWSIPEVIGKLDGLRDWMIKHRDATHWQERLASCCLDALAQIDIPPERVYIGRCPTDQCTVELWPTMGDAVTVCPGCKAQVDVRARTREGLRRVERYEAPLSRIVEVLSAAGEKITIEQARHWTKRDDGRGRLLLVPRGKGPRGVNHYRLGDVRSVLLRMQKRRAASRG